MNQSTPPALPQTHSYLKEVSAIFRLGLPIIATQTAQAAMGFTDTLMAGHYSDIDLAAIAIGASLWMPVLLALTGILLATTPLVSQAFGAGRHDKISQVIQQALWLALLLGLLGAALLWQANPVFTMMKVDPQVSVISTEYLKALAWGAPAAAFYQVLRSGNEALQRTQPIMIISVIALICNIPLNYLLIYGIGFFPELGGVGCGWATAFVMWLQFLALVWYSVKGSSFNIAPFWHHWRRPDLAQLAELLRLGIPIGISLFVEVSMFSVIALFLAPLGHQVVAGHQITISFSGLIFMIPLSLAMALTIRCSYALGMGNPAYARFVWRTGLIVALVIATLSASLMFFFGKQIASLYTNSEDIHLIATSLLALAAIFQFSDAIQVTAAGALRGYKDTTMPLVAVFIAYWLIGLPLGYSLGLTELLGTARGPEGFWIGLILGLTIAALLLTWRLRKITAESLAPLTNMPSSSYTRTDP